MVRIHEKQMEDLSQFQNIIETWKQLLESGMEENVLQKNRIADILKNSYSHGSLEEIEEFQTWFVIKDESIFL